MNRGRVQVALLGVLAWMVASADVLVTVDAADEVGPVKAIAEQSRGSFADRKALREPYARAHDSLNQLGTQVRTKVEPPDRGAVTAVAAKGRDGNLGILVTRFADDGNVTAPEKVAVRLAKGGFSGRVRAYVTDGVRLQSPVPLEPDHRGVASFDLAPNAFAYIETKAEPMAVVLTFDDAVKDHLLVAAPELEKRGWRGIFCIVPAWIGMNERKLTWDDVRELKRRGHEISSHTFSHVDLGKLVREGKLDEVRREIASARDAIAKEIGEEPKVLCIPFGSIEPEVYRIAEEERQIVLPLNRCNFGKGSKVGTEWGVKAYIYSRFAKGTGYCDVLSHGIRASGGGWQPFATEKDFTTHLDDIASFGDSLRVVVGEEAHAMMRRHEQLTRAADETRR